MNKILSKLMEMRDQLEKDWRSDLVDLNMWEEVRFLYGHGSVKPLDLRDSNTILVFIGLAYDNESPSIDIDQDRLENKMDIFKSLAGLNWNLNEHYVDACAGVKSPYEEVIEWYIDRQMDWRWSGILANIEYHSKATALARGARDPKSIMDSGKMLASAKASRLEANTDMKKLQEEFVALDVALNREKRKKITDRTTKSGKVESHEIWILGSTSKIDKDSDEPFNMDQEDAD